MMTNRYQKLRESGSVLFISLILAGILGLTLGSYLYWVRTQNLLVAESQGWNHALAIAEAGIEEGMAQINQKFGTNSLDLASGNGWGSSGSGIYSRMNSVGSNSYSVVIDSNDQTAMRGPTIYSTGTVTVATMPRKVNRVVRVTTAIMPIFSSAMAAQSNIVFNGNNIVVDSYDSSDSQYSTGGFYDPAKHKAGGDVASNGGLINVGNANIFGHLRTAPFGAYSVGPGGQVGDLNWAPKSGDPNRIESGWYINDFNMEFRDVDAPDTSSWLPAAGVTGDTNKYVLQGGKFIINGDLSLKAGETILVTGNATLYVSGNVNMSSQGQGRNVSQINIGPGATLKIYVAGASASFTQVNTAGNASSFQYFGLPSNTAVSWSANSVYLGTVYAPEATFTLGGGGSTPLDYQGSCIVNSINVNGHFSFHFDEALKRNSPPTAFTVASWTELPPN